MLASIQRSSFWSPRASASTETRRGKIAVPLEADARNRLRQRLPTRNTNHTDVPGWTSLQAALSRPLRCAPVPPANHANNPYYPYSDLRSRSIASEVPSPLRDFTTAAGALVCEEVWADRGKASVPNKLTGEILQVLVDPQTPFETHSFGKNQTSPETVRTQRKTPGLTPKLSGTMPRLPSGTTSKTAKRLPPSGVEPLIVDIQKLEETA